MRQVPCNRDSLSLFCYGIIGAGRIARHISRYFDLAGVPYIQKGCRDLSSQEIISTFSECEILLVVISDDQIEEFIKTKLGFHPKSAIVHFSGCLSLPGIQSAHPLMTFADGLYDLEFYKRIPFVCEKNKTRFTDLFPALQNTVHYIDSESKTYYHALCVMAGNFTTLLWQKLFRGFEISLGIPHESAHLYMQKIAENLILAPEKALTGPFARGDDRVIEKHFAALRNDSFCGVYSAFAELFGKKLEKKND
ncbi:MAG: DUF2520 domain-containing protein [Candidatus Riflebacteria bacterium]|nr:DUF2520 domain-containing protein [Candidatus Riflebacteria bacterium]